MAKRKKGQNFIGIFILNQYFLTILGLAILVLISFPLAKNISQRHKIDDEIKGFEQEIETVEGKNNGLKKVINYLGSEQFTEEQARLKFGLKKPGEEVIAVKNDSKIAESGIDAKIKDKIFTISGLEKVKEKPVTNPERWRNYFFGSLHK